MNKCTPPLADQFAAWTPYHYVTNSPNNIIDPDGRDTLNIHRGSLNTELSDEFTNVWNITFSITVNGYTLPVSLEKGIDEIYMFGSKAGDSDGDNFLNKDSYVLSFEEMPSKPDLESTIRVGGKDFGVFFHQGNNSEDFGGCKSVCESYTRRENSFGDKSFYGLSTLPTLGKIKALHDSYGDRLTGSKFLLKTRSQADDYLNIINYID